jgi:carbon storage regulator CsrA
MLCILRRPQESIVITCPDGTEIEIVNCRTRGNQTVIGIEAPLEYVVDRYEIYMRKKREAQSADPNGNVAGA